MAPAAESAVRLFDETAEQRRLLSHGASPLISILAAGSRPGRLVGLSYYLLTAAMVRSKKA